MKPKRKPKNLEQAILLGISHGVAEYFSPVLFMVRKAQQALRTARPLRQ